MSSAKPQNHAAYVDAPGSPVVVREAPYTSPSATQVTIRARAFAINPVDRFVQLRGPGLFPWLTYPIMFGCDVAGVVHEVGSSVTHVKVGDRVVAATGGVMKNSHPTCGFQEYVVAESRVVGKIPDKVDFAHAAMIPIALVTASAGLYDSTLLNLKLPSAEEQPASGEGEEGQRETVLIWGGATSLGVQAVQLARASGYDSVVTASAMHHEYLRSLGATHLVDYHSASAVADISAIFATRSCAGALCCAMPGGAVQSCAEILAGVPKGKKYLASAVWLPEGYAFPEGVGYKFFTPDYTRESNPLGPVILGEWLPRALETGVLKPAPECVVYGTGLESIQGAMERWEAGVRGQKIVVKME